MSALQTVVSSEEVRKHLRKTAKRIWCAGCGNGICLGAMIRAMVETGIPADDFVVISGIGCAGRCAQYVTYDSIQSPHGRTLPVATGIKLARPKMRPMVFTGDGDLVGIGGNHLIHAARRNLDVTVVLVNNFIYGMTGGQVAPTTPHADFAATAPYGNLESPPDVCALVAAAGATYVARTTAYHVRQMVSFIRKGIENNGFSLIEVISDCITQYGKLNSKGTAAQMLTEYKKAAITVEKAAGLSAEQLAGKYVIGEFVAGKSRPELSAAHQALIDRLSQERIQA
jgi:2-oxoglutarate ferredoxin oxidoreductase subunit beta